MAALRARGEGQGWIWRVGDCKRQEGVWAAASRSRGQAQNRSLPKLGLEEHC